MFHIPSVNNPIVTFCFPYDFFFSQDCASFRVKHCGFSSWPGKLQALLISGERIFPKIRNRKCSISSATARIANRRTKPVSTKVISNKGVFFFNDNKRDVRDSHYVL